ncbi:MAG: VapC toxin family PIN domain ribonuclease, partial [Planctomycetota bacterium]
MEEALAGVSAILMDSAPAIYHLERHPRYAPVLDRFFRVRRERDILIVASPVTLAECLVRPEQQ